MRMRKKKNADIRMQSCADYFISEKPYAEKDVMIEIGCGKGGFMLQLAKKHPETQFVCIEKISDVILLAAEKMKREELKNVKLINCDAESLTEYFAPGSVKRIYLNFSDPWPRPKHAKRRLTAPKYLEIYKALLCEGGAIFFKTDNRIIFDYSLETLKAAGFRLEKLTYDLHNSEYEAENLHTEYEDNFSAKGFAINRVEAYK
jgi:tRNA (guanine-N7-)-methyltransferase